MSAITQVAKEHSVPIELVGSAALKMWREVEIDDLTYDMVESALYEYYEQNIPEDAEEVLYP